MKNSFIIIFVTCASKKEAGLLSDLLLKKRLVACANIIEGVDSKFWWHGKVDKAHETLVIFKTGADKFKAVQREVLRLHSYDTPEIIAIPIVAGSKDYLNWIKSSLK